MIVSKTVVLNRHEPAPLSFRAPLGMDTRLNLAYFNNSGAPYSSDLAAQLQLTGRSTARTTTYLIPATDIVNGRAQAFVPGGDLSDTNGYRLRLLGTLSGEPTLLAVGTVMPIASAGLEAVPLDTVDSVDLSFQYDEAVDLDVVVWQDAGKGNPFNLTSNLTTLTAAIYDVKGGSMLMPFTTTVIDANKVRLSLTVAQVNTLPASCWWSMVASTSAGATMLCEGSVTITGVITPPLIEAIAVYDYQKPPSGDVNPIGGQIIHNTISQNLLKVAKTTQALVDFSATLALVSPGCLITIGVTQWTVIASSDAGAWYEFFVSPVQQAAVSGVNPVTFSPSPVT